MGGTFTSISSDEIKRTRTGQEYIWPRGQQQARYLEASEFPPLVNISFNFGPYAPFSYEWALKERKGNWLPTSKEEPSWMDRISNMKGLLGGTEQANKVLEETYPEALAQDKADEVGDAFQGIFGGKNPASNLFDAALSAPGEIASEGLLQDPEIIDMLMKSKEFKDQYWEHLDGDLRYGDVMESSDYKSFFSKEYLDKSPITEQGRHSLSLLLTALKNLPEFADDSDILNDIMGAEETIDQESKIVSKDLRSHWIDISSKGGTVQQAINKTATGMQTELNEFLDDAKAYIKKMEKALPEGAELLVPLETSMEGYFDTFLDSKGPIASYAVKGVKQPAAKPTKGAEAMKRLGEIRQFLRRAIQTAMMSAVGEGTELSSVKSGKWMYQVPAPLGYAAIFIVKVDLGGGIGQKDGKYQIPDGMKFEVIGRAVKAELEGEMSGSMDALIFQAGIQTGAWTADYLTTFIAKRNTYLGAYALLNALNGDDVWQQHSENVLDSISQSTIAQPMMGVTGVGTPNSRLTPAVLAEIIKDNLRKFAKSGATNTMIKTAIKKTFNDSNILTESWKEAFLAKASNRSNILSTRFIYSRDAGIWHKGKDAMQDFKGRGFAGSPLLGFSQAKVENQVDFRSQVQTMSEGWSVMKARMAKGMFAEGDRAFSERLGREQL